MQKLLFLTCILSLSLFSCNTTPSSKEKKLTLKEFTHADIGAATRPGTTTGNQNQVVVNASGADIWGTNDEFRFSYMKLKGDFDFCTQIESLTATNLYTKAGIMARQSLADDCQHVYFQVFPDNSARNNNNGGCEFQYRTEEGGEMKAIYPGSAIEKDDYNVDFPNTYIRLVRKGTDFESYFSNDNKNWKLYSRFTTTLPDELFVGLAVTSHNSEEFTAAVFSQIQLKN